MSEMDPPLRLAQSQHMPSCEKESGGASSRTLSNTYRQASPLEPEAECRFTTDIPEATSLHVNIGHKVSSSHNTSSATEAILQSIDTEDACLSITTIPQTANIKANIRSTASSTTNSELTSLVSSSDIGPCTSTTSKITFPLHGYLSTRETSKAMLNPTPRFTGVPLEIRHFVYELLITCSHCIIVSYSSLSSGPLFALSLASKTLGNEIDYWAQCKTVKYQIQRTGEVVDVPLIKTKAFHILHPIFTTWEFEFSESMERDRALQILHEVRETAPARDGGPIEERLIRAFARWKELIFRTGDGFGYSIAMEKRFDLLAKENISSVLAYKVFFAPGFFGNLS